MGVEIVFFFYVLLKRELEKMLRVLCIEHVHVHTFLGFTHCEHFQAFRGIKIMKKNEQTKTCLLL